jgi:hypothetical protein
VAPFAPALNASPYQAFAVWPGWSSVKPVPPVELTGALRMIASWSSGVVSPR